MIRHPRFPDYVAVDHHSHTPLDRIRVLGPHAEKACFECPGRECGPKAEGVCPISGVWMRLTSVALLRLEGVPVRFDTYVNLEKLTSCHNPSSPPPSPTASPLRSTAPSSPETLRATG